MGHHPRPLTSIEGGADPADSQLVRGSPRPPAHGTPAGATDGASPYCGSCTRTDPEDVGVQARSSNRLACPAMLEAMGGEDNDASEGRGDHTRFTSRSMAVSELMVCFLDTGTSPRFFIACPLPVDAAVGARCSTEVATTPRSLSSLEVLPSPPISVGSSNSSSASTSLWFYRPAPAG